MSGPILLAVRLAITIALYAFIGVAFYALWRDLNQRSRAITVPQIPQLLLSLTLDSEIRQCQFAQARVTIGRDPACDLHLPEITISGRHACLSYHHAQWWVEDLRSTNGTFLNDQQVVEPQVLANGDRLRCGKVEMELKIDVR